MEKTNDWLVANINNPDYSPGDFRATGMSAENTQMLSKEEYLKSDFIKTNRLFLDSHGDFDNKKFDNYYNYALSAYQDFTEIDNGFLYDQFDARRTRKPNSLVKSPDLVMYLFSNPDEVTIGNSFVNEATPSPFSTRELAEQNNVVDFETGETLLYSPNDHALFSDPVEWFVDIFKEPLVLATYDLDGTHEDPITGLIVEHKKGTPKINENGKYYYETLGGRSLAGKQVLSRFDNLTVDGSSLNAVDFFDSDDKDKSIAGSIAKNVAMVVPLFIGGEIGAAVSIALTLRELGKVLPLVDGMTSLVTGNLPDTAFTKFANNMAGRMTGLTSSTSDYALQNMFGFENFANLASDVALLWGQLSTVVKAWTKLRGSDKLLENAEKSAFKTWKMQSPVLANLMRNEGASEAAIKAAIGTEATWKTSNLGHSLLTNASNAALTLMAKTLKLGLDVSLVYMALISNPDVYTTMLEYGCTKREAAMVTLASTTAMFSVDKFLGLGEMFYNEVDAAKAASIRASLLHDSKGFMKSLAESIKGTAGSAKSDLNIMQKAISGFKKIYNDFWDGVKNHSLGGFGKAIGEGLEEVSEEFTTDLSKLLYELAASWEPTDKLLGDLTTDNVGAFNDFSNNPNWVTELLSRYTINFLGGFMGGGIFYAKEKFQAPKNAGKVNDSLILAVYQYGKNDVLRILDQWHKKGKLGSTTQSTQISQDADGNYVFLSASLSNPSLNDVIYQNLKGSIETIDKMINDKEAYYSEDEMIKNLTLGDVRFLMLNDLTTSDYTEGLRNQMKDIILKYVKTLEQIKIAEKDILTADSNIALRHKKEELKQKLEEHAEELSKQLDSFKSERMAIEYMDQMMFAIDDRVNKAFMTPNFSTWLSKYRKNSIDGIEISPMTVEQFNRLNDSEKEAIREEYRNYVRAKRKEDARIAYLGYKYIRDMTRDEIQDLNSSLRIYKEQIKVYDELTNPDTNPLTNLVKVKPEEITEDNTDDELKLDYDEVHDLLSPDNEISFVNRNQRSGESNEDYLERRKKRIKHLQKIKATQINTNRIYDALRRVKEIIQNADSKLDVITRRKLKLLMNANQDEIKNIFIEQNLLLDIIPNLSNEIKQILKNLPNNHDYSLLLLIRDLIVNLFAKNLEKDILKFRTTNSSILQQITDAYLKLDLTDPNVLAQHLLPIGLVRMLISKMTITGNYLYYALNENGYSDTSRTDFLNYNKLWSDILKVINRIDNSKLQELIDTYNDNTISDDIKNDLDKLINTLLTSTKKLIKKAIRKSTDLSGHLDLFTLLSENSIQNDLRNIIISSSLDGLKPLIKINFNQLSKYQIDLILDFFKTKILYKLNDDLKNLILTLLIPSNGLFNLNKIKALTFNWGSNLDELIMFSENGSTILDSDYDVLTEAFNMSILAKSGYNDSYEFTKSELKDKSHLLYQDGNWIINVKQLSESYSAFQDHIFEDFVDSYNIYSDEDGFPMVVIGYNQLEKDLENKTKQQISNIFDLEVSRLYNDPVFSYLSEINNAEPILNPITPLLKKLNNLMGNPLLDVESLMESIEHSRDENGYATWTLSDSLLIEQLEDAKRLLYLLQSMLHSSLDSLAYLNPIPHNKIMNQVILEHNLKEELLPLIDDEVGEAYVLVIQDMINTIGELDPETGQYTDFSILEWNRKNSYNKTQDLIKSKEADISTTILFFTLNKELFKSTDGSINLLPNIETILNSSDLPIKKLINIKRDFYNSVKKYLEDNPGKTVTDVFDSVQLNLIFNDREAFLDLHIADLNGNLTYGQLTPMSKAMQLISTICIDPINAELFFADFFISHNNIASLSNLQRVAMPAIANIENHELYQQGLQWIWKHFTDIKPGEKITLIFSDSTVIVGNGGAGKTEVVIRSILDYAKYKKGYTDDQIIYSGPTLNQVDNLRKLNIGKGLFVDDILKLIYGKDEFNKFINEFNTDKNTWTNTLMSPWESLIAALSTNYTFANSDIKVIIIDEATWIDSLRLSMLSEYAHRTGASLIYVGDLFLSGYKKDTRRANINTDSIFTGRSDRLAITLRDCNIQKYNNILETGTLLNKMLTISANDPSRNLKIKLCLDYLKYKFCLKYYDSDIINGDLIVQNLTQDILDKLDLVTKYNLDGTKASEPIAYLGTNESTYNKLVSKFGEANVVKFTDISLIQGREFSNIIIDIPLKAPTETNNLEANLSLNITWLTNINTVLTRGKNAAIIIDNSLELKSALHNTRDTFKNNKTNFNAEAILKFNDSAKADALILGITGHNYITTSPTTSPTTSTSSSTSTSSTISTTTSTSSPTTGARFSINNHLANIEEEANETGVVAITPETQSCEKLAEDDKDTNNINDDGEIDPDSALVYGDNTLSGMTVETKEVPYITADGEEKTNNIRVYYPSDPNTIKAFYDVDALALFFGYKDGFTYKNDDGTINECFEKYEVLRNYLLNGVSYDDAMMTDLWKNTFSDKLLISREDYSKILSGENIKIEITPYLKKHPNFIGRSHLSEDEDAMSIATIDSEKLVFTLVATYQIGDTGKTGKITLGMFADPLHFSSPQVIDKIEKNLLKQVTELEDKISTTSSELSIPLKRELNKIKQYLNSLHSTDANINPTLNYQNHINLLALQYLKAKQNGELEDGITLVVDVPGKIRFNRDTGVKNNVRNHDGTVPRLRLETVDNGDRKFLGRSFMDFNPGVTVSPVYIYRAQDGALLSVIDSSRACVFVTTSPILSPGNLVDTWCYELSSGNRGSRTVRMIKLDNCGVTWGELVNKEKRKLYNFRDTSIENAYAERTPFANDVMAIRMILAIHNWNLDLSLFERNLKNACISGVFEPFYHGDYNLMIKTCRALGGNSLMHRALVKLHDEYIKYHEQNPDKTEADFEADFQSKAGSSNTDQLACAIILFNNSLDSGCRRFRLGIGNKTTNLIGEVSLDLRGKVAKRERNGFLIRKINKTDTGMYAGEKGNVYGIYLTPDMFYDFKESTLEIINVIKAMDLNINFTVSGNNYSIGDEIRIPTYITVNGNKISTTNALFTHMQGSPVTMTTDRVKLALLRYFPSGLLKLGGRASLTDKLKFVLEENGKIKLDAAGNPMMRLPSIRRRNKETGKQEWIVRYAKLKLWKNFWIPKYKEDPTSKNIIKDPDLKSLGISVNHSFSIGNDFNAMMELLFHGSTMNVVLARLRASNTYGAEHIKSNPLDVEPQSTDAFFKYGFLIDPFAKKGYTFESTANNLRKSFVETTAAPYAFTAQARIAKPTITISFAAPKTSDIDTKTTELGSGSQENIYDAYQTSLQNLFDKPEVTANDKIQGFELLFNQFQNDDLTNIQTTLNNIFEFLNNSDLDIRVLLERFRMQPSFLYGDGKFIHKFLYLDKYYNIIIDNKKLENGKFSMLISNENLSNDNLGDVDNNFTASVISELAEKFEDENPEVANLLNEISDAINNGEDFESIILSDNNGQLKLLELLENAENFEEEDWFEDESDPRIAMYDYWSNADEVSVKGFIDYLINKNSKC